MNSAHTSDPALPVAAPARPLRVLSIWHGAVRALNRERYDALAQTEHLDLTVFAPKRWEAALPRPLDYEPAANHGYRVIKASAWWRRHAAFHFYPRLFSVLSATRPDLIDLYEEPYTLIAWLVAWWRNQFAPGSRLVFTACQNIHKRYPPPFRWMEKYVLQSADGAMGLNRNAVEVFRAKGYDGPFEVVPTGIDPEKFRRMRNSEFGIRNRENQPQLDADLPVIGYVGRLVEEKGVATLLEACAIGREKEHRQDACATHGKGFQLLIVGDGAEKEALRRRAGELGIADRVVWAGSVASADMVRYLSAMEVLVLPSLTRPHWKEQLGRVLIEAMACEAAVVGSRSGAIPDVIGDAGLLFEEGDAAQLRAAIDRLLGDDAYRRELTARGRLRVENEFSWSAIASKTRALWQQAIDRPPLEIRRRTK